MNCFFFVVVAYFTYMVCFNMHCMQYTSPVAIYKALHADVTLIEVILF